MQNRLITLNLRRYLSTQPRTKRINKCVKFVIARVAHLTKTDPDSIKIDQNLNTLIFKKYSKTMVPMRVNVSIDNGKAGMGVDKIRLEADGRFVVGDDDLVLLT